MADDFFDEVEKMQGWLNKAKLKELDYWRLCDDLSVVQAAFLIAGYNPEEYLRFIHSEEFVPPNGYEAAKSALANAIEMERLPAKKDEGLEEGPFSSPVYYHNLEGTLISVQDLKHWLSTHNVHPEFFFPDGNNSPTYLDSKAKYYAPKLAAALKAWEAVTTDETLLKSQSPKAALKKWLREHAASYGLTKDDGTHNETAIEEIAKIANWQPTGGAPKTPDNGEDDQPST